MNKYILYFVVIVGFYGLNCAIFADIVILKSKSGISSYDLAADGFKSVVPDDNINVYDMDEKVALGRKLVKKIRKESPSVILTIGMMASKLVQEEITDIPVIFCMVINPAKSNLSGYNNIGGVSFDLSAESQLSRLHEIIPDLKSVGVMYNPENSNNIIKKAKEFAESSNFDIVAREVYSKNDVPDVLADLIREVQVLWLIPDNMVLDRESFKFINLTTLENRVPVLACSPQLVKMGSPFCFFADEFLVGKQAGNIYMKFIKENGKGALPIEHPEDIFMAVNLTTMKRCSLNMSPDVLESAKKVYK